MSLFSILRKGFSAMYQEAIKSESFKTGEDFENFVRQKLFISTYYEVIERTHSYQNNRKDFVKSSLKPDFTLLDRMTKKEFYLEAKFRRQLYNGKIQWCEQEQLKRYQQYNREKSSFLILGFENEPNQPQSVYLIPMGEAKFTGLYPNYLRQFLISSNEPVKSKILWGK